jgi:hypothetical protein
MSMDTTVLDARNQTHVDAPRAPSPDPREWLTLWPTGRRSLLANLFHVAVRQGACTPRTVVAAVIQDLQRRLQRGNDPTLSAVLEQLQSDPTLALHYAETVITYEHLPSAERQAQKTARARIHQMAYMQEMPVTEKQGAFLRALGYTGALPANRAEASTLIDGLLNTQRGGRS